MTKPVAAILLGGCDSGLPRRLREVTDGQPPPPLVALMKRLATAGITVTVVEDLEEARAVADVRDDPPAVKLSAMDDSGVVASPYRLRRVTPVLLDLQGCASDDPEDLEAAHRVIADCSAAFHGQGPIAVTSGAPPRLLLECFRAGAADVIDLGHEGTARARAVVLRVVALEERRRAERQLAHEQRTLIDELVRDLVRTERRTIDLEDQLHREHPPSGDDSVYLERIKQRHELLLARYLEIKGGS